MRIAFIEMEGFRGVRTHQRLNVPEGFMVLVGRNGSGKSTICDAIEFAFTGLLSKYSDGTEKGESAAEYAWWRGQVPADRNFVRIGLRDDTGREVSVYRTPTGVEVSDGREIANILCDVSTMTRDPVVQLCRTAIIRDETIAALSIDLAETDRFAFVRTALGTDALENVTSRRKTLLTGLRKQVESASANYANARGDLTALLSQLAQARAGVEHVPDVIAAEAVVREVLGAESLEVSQLLDAARQKIADTRRAEDDMMRLARDLELIRAETRDLKNDEASGIHAELESRKSALEQQIQDSARTLDKMQLDAQAAQEKAPVRATLASLYQAGKVIGLRGDACPLCATAMPIMQFEHALDALSHELGDAERDAAFRRQELSEANARLAELRRNLSDVAGRLRQVEVMSSQLSNRLNLLMIQAKAYTLVTENDIDPAVLIREVERGQAQLDKLARAVSILEASAVLERVAELDNRLLVAKEISVALEKRLREMEAAEARAKRLLVGIQRAVGEMVEERLASLDPLLKDLYVRLRPHTDWLDLSYTVRGDVRKFLSLRVGDDVNPRFTFSSGQRRAIGLAFLLAVHLSRPWCHLKSLILDDPVQHIDDYRALHLVEVLAAIRRAGQQVICAVEDEALAQLMCRRIRTGVDGEGALVHMVYRSGDGAGIERTTVVPSAVRHLVLSA